MDPSLLLVKVADCLIGTAEVGGDNKGPMVTELQRTVGDYTASAWCLSFVQSCIAYVEEKLSIESPLVATEHVLTLWNASPKCCRTDLPQPGDIILWKMGSTLSGHCGIIVEVGEHQFCTIEGNTSDSDHYIERMGDGVYLKARKRGGMGNFREIGFLRPFLCQNTPQTSLIQLDLNQECLLHKDVLRQDLPHGDRIPLSHTQ